MTATNVTLSDRRWLILASAVVSFFAVGTTFFAVPPLVPQLTAAFGLNHFHIGLLVGAIAVPAIVLSIPLGAAVDRWPARAAGNVGLVLMFIGAGFFAAAPSYAFLLTGRLLFGIGGLLINLLLARLIATAFAGRELALAMGIFLAVYPAGLISLFSAHPFLLEHLGWRGELGVLAGLVLIAIPLHTLAVPRGLRGSPVGDAEVSGFRTKASPSLIALAISWMLFFAAYASVPTFAPEWAGGGPRALLTVTIIMWTAAVLSPVFGSIIDHLGRPGPWVVGGLLALAAALALMSVEAITPVVAMLVIGVSAAAVTTATYALPPQLVAPARVGFAFGFITAFSNLGTVIGPPVAGALRDHSGGWTLTWSVLAAVALLGAAAAVLVRPKST